MKAAVAEAERSRAEAMQVLQVARAVIAWNVRAYEQHRSPDSEPNCSLW
jgi:hypothetical protein